MHLYVLQATAIPGQELKRSLQSLACVKGRNVLRKEPMSKDIGEEDAFVFNDRFTSTLVKVKIGTVVAQKETEPEKADTRQRVEEVRVRARKCKSAGPLKNVAMPSPSRRNALNSARALIPSFLCRTESRRSRRPSCAS